MPAPTRCRRLRGSGTLLGDTPAAAVPHDAAQPAPWLHGSDCTPAGGPRSLWAPSLASCTAVRLSARGACCPCERALRACIPREGYGWTPRKTCFKMPIHLARSSMEAAMQYAKERETFGTKIGNSQRL